MAHEIDMSNGNVNMSYRLGSETPWHGLGHQISSVASLDDWIEKSGFGWNVMTGQLAYFPSAIGEGADLDLGAPAILPDKVCLYRSDTKAPLSTVSSSYKVVQPRQVAEFFREICETGHFEMDTMGMLQGGAKYWALARIKDQFSVTKDDPILPYVLMATSCDGSLASTAGFTLMRPVCANTLAPAVNEKNNNGQIKVPHNSLFDDKKIKAELGLIDGQWDYMKKASKELAYRKVSREEVVKFMLSVFVPESKVPDCSFKEVEDLLAKMPNVVKALDLYENGVGQQTKSAKGTAWGCVNAISRMVDHETKAISADSRLRSAWFGAGKRTKAKALTLAMGLLK
jgi:phage/plasmid-like protein (TIGR03299 family)